MIQYRGLRDFISKMQDLGDVKDIEGADRNLEIGALAEIATDKDDYPLLLFDNVKGYSPGFRLATNVVRHRRRAAYASGVPVDLSPIEMVHFWKDKIKNFKAIPPVEVSDGPVMENVDEGDKVNMLKFPAPLWHQLDGGPYIGTADAVITKDPDEGWVNLGAYRVQVHDKKTLGIMIQRGHHGDVMRRKYWEKGKSCPVAVDVGSDPRIFIASSYKHFGWGESEYGYAGWLQGSPVKTIVSKYTGIPFPAESEIVIEGEMPPPTEETRLEGSFGESTGYYAHVAAQEPVIRVKRVYYRNDPIIHGSAPLLPFPGKSHFGIDIWSARYWQQLENMGIPDVKGVGCHFMGGMFIVIAIKQRYAGHAMQAACALLASGPIPFKFIIIVDEDVDPLNASEVLWVLGSRVDPETQITITKQMGSNLLDPILSPDKRERHDMTGSTAIILATRPYYWKDKFPVVNAMTKQQKAPYMEKCKSLGLA